MERPVVIIHGYADTKRMVWWEQLKMRLIESGYEESEVYITDFSRDGIFGTSIGSPRDYAWKVEEKIDQVLNEEVPEAEEVDIIAHSMGGLDARWYIEELGGAENVNKLITLGTPHKGTKAAEIGSWTSGGKDMLPGSDFLEELNNSPLAEDVEYITIWSDGDELVIPSESAKLEGVKNINPGFFTHINMVRSEEVFNKAILPSLLEGDDLENALKNRVRDSEKLLKDILGEDFEKGKARIEEFNKEVESFLENLEDEYSEKLNDESFGNFNLKNENLLETIWGENFRDGKVRIEEFNKKVGSFLKSE